MKPTKWGGLLISMLPAPLLGMRQTMDTQVGVPYGGTSDTLGG